MRAVSIRLCRAAASAVVAKPTVSAPVTAPVAGSPAHVAGKSAVGLRSEAVARRVEAVTDRLFAGSSDGAAYAPTSPILRAALGQPRPVRQPSPSVVQRPVATPAPAPVVEPKKTLAELENLPAVELRRMLAVRSVSLGSVTEKAELAKWVHQHQDLPVERREACPSEALRPSTRRGDSHSLVDLQQMSVAELRRVLQDRGVGEGPATEKSDLINWVWQHQHLPVLRERDPRRQQKSRTGRRVFGGHGDADPYDLPKDNPKPEQPEQDKIEGDDVRLLEGDSGTRLLEGAASEDAFPSRWSCWLLIPVIAIATVALVVGVLIGNDMRRAAAEGANVNTSESPATRHEFHQ